MFRKKWLASLLSLMMVFAFMPMSSFAFAAQEDEEVAVEEEILVDEETPAEEESEAPTQDVKVAEDEAPAVDVTISGSDQVEQFSTIDLKANITGAKAGATVKWSSLDTTVLTVANNGKVTGVAKGTTSVKVEVSISGQRTVATATKEITVVAPTKDDIADFYYLKTPTCDPKSNSTTQWGDCFGRGDINTKGAQFDDNDKNCYVHGDASRVVTWPAGFENGVVPNTKKSDDHWHVIFKAFKSEAEKKLNIENIKEEDVQEIILHPYKISQYNGNPSRHVDCTVEIIVKDIYTAKYYLWDAEASGYVQMQADYVSAGNTTSKNETVAGLSAEKTVNDVKYRLHGWFENEDLSGGEVSFPYTVNSNVDFYAKYVPVSSYFVNYDLNKGSWGDRPLAESHQIGDNVFVAKEVPTRAGYEFAGWTVEGLDGKATISSGEEFTMPENNVNIKANWTASVATIQFETNGGSEVDPITGTTGGAIEDQTMPTTTRDGYDFDGWYANSDLTGDKVETLPETFPAGTTTYYAKWTEKAKHTVSFDVQGHGTAPEDQTVVDGSKASKPDEDPSEDGYTFDGWFADPEGETPFDFDSEIKEDTIIYGKWTKIEEPVPSVIPEVPTDPTPGPGPGPNPGPAPGPNGGGVAGGGAAVAAVANAAVAPAQNYSLTQIDDGETPLANGLLDADCCILHLLIMLAAMIMLVWYTHDMKKRQARIFELEDELEGYDE